MSKDLKKAEYFVIYRSLLTEKQQETLDMYYINDLSLSEISKEINIARQGVFNCINKSEEKLVELEAALGLYRKRDEMNKAVNELKAVIKGGNKKVAMELADKLKDIY